MGGFTHYRCHTHNILVDCIQKGTYYCGKIYSFSDIIDQEKLRIRQFEQHTDLEHEFKQSNKLLLNTLAPRLVERLNAGEFPICDKRDDATITYISVIIPAMDDDAGLVALSDIFCISFLFLYMSLSSYFDLGYILDDHIPDDMEKVRGSDDFITCSFGDVTIAVSYAVAVINAIREYPYNFTRQYF